MHTSTALRQALGHFATGVTVMTTRTPGGEPIGVTVNSFNSVSLDPPLVLWSLARKAYSCPAFDREGHFAVHVLAADQHHLSTRFAQAGHDKFAGLTLAEGVAGVPLLADCAAVFQCQTVARHEGGDHVILLGKVLTYQCAERPPLLFHRGRYVLPPQAVAA